MTLLTPTQASEIVDLLPCPFCGGQASLSSFEGKHAVECLGVDCFCTLGMDYDNAAMPDFTYYTEKQAIHAWNLRNRRNDASNANTGK